MPSLPMGCVDCDLGVEEDMVVDVELGGHVDSDIAILMIQVKTSFIAPAEPTLPALAVQITRLVDSYMVWVGVTAETGETVGDAPRSGALCRDWACAMPPAVSADSAVSSRALRVLQQGGAGTTLYRTPGSDVAHGMAQRLGGSLSVSLVGWAESSSATDGYARVFVSRHWGHTAWTARVGGGEGDRGGARVVVALSYTSTEPTLNRCRRGRRRPRRFCSPPSMSEPELAYMSNANDDFDLPRWQTQTHLEPLSSSAQAAQAAARASYLYPAPPPPPQTLPQQRLQQVQHSPGSSRQPRIAHLLDQDHQQSLSPSAYLSGALNQLSRSASLGASASVSGASRVRRHHHPDDLEGAFNVDTQPSARHIPAAQQPPSSLYPSGVAFHQSNQLSAPAPANAVSPTAPEPYSDMYYNGTTGNPPKRSHTQHDPASRSGRSPMRTGNSLLDPYQQQAQYSPTATPSYLYASSSDAQRGNPPSNYPSHTRNHSQTKPEVSTPPIGTPFSPQSSAQVAYAGYAMESSSPQPPSHQNPSLLSAQLPVKNSTSTPSTPLSFAHSQSPANQFYPQEQPMLVDPAPQHRRRASGFRRVRDSRDLRPYVNNHPAGRRVDSNGTVLSVCAPLHPPTRADSRSSFLCSHYGS